MVLNGGVLYFALTLLETDKSFLKSEYVRGSALHRVSGQGDFSNCVHALMHRPTLPVLILVGLHFIEAVINADGFVHAFCS